MTNHIRPKKQKICAEEMAQAFEMREAGEKLIDIAMTLNVSENYISKCFNLAAEKGFGRFPPRDRPNRPSGLALMQCFCGKKYEAKRSDLKRGYGFSCSAKCRDIRRGALFLSATEIESGPNDRHPKKEIRRPWTNKEVKFLVENYGICKSKYIANSLGRSARSVMMMASDLKLKGYRNKIKVDIDEVKELIDFGYNSDAIGRMTKSSGRTIRRIAAEKLDGNARQKLRTNGKESRIRALKKDASTKASQIILLS